LDENYQVNLFSIYHISGRFLIRMRGQRAEGNHIRILYLLVFARLHETIGWISGDLRKSSDFSGKLCVLPSDEFQMRLPDCSAGL
jgi:hypothetical protein